MPAVLLCLDNLYKWYDYSGNLISFWESEILAGKGCPQDYPSKKILNFEYQKDFPKQTYDMCVGAARGRMHLV